MVLNYYKIYQDKVTKEKELKNLCEYLEKVLNPTEMSSFMNELKEAKKIIDKDNIEKTEDVFKLFIYKLYNISNNKSIFIILF